MAFCFFRIAAILQGIKKRAQMGSCSAEADRRRSWLSRSQLWAQPASRRAVLASEAGARHATDCFFLAVAAEFAAAETQERAPPCPLAQHLPFRALFWAAVGGGRRRELLGRR